MWKHWFIGVFDIGYDVDVKVLVVMERVLRKVRSIAKGRAVELVELRNNLGCGVIAKMHSSSNPIQNKSGPLL